MDGPCNLAISDLSPRPQKRQKKKKSSELKEEKQARKMAEDGFLCR